MIHLTPIHLAVIQATALISSPSADEGSGNEILSPSSPWNVDYADSECRLTRTFGTGPETTIFRISRGANLKAFQYSFAGKALKIRDWNYSALLRPGPGETSHKLPVLWYRLPTGENALQLFGESGLKPAEIASARTLSLEVHGAEPLQLAVGSLEKPLAALEACYDDLLTSWSIDPAKIRDLQAAARPINIHTWHVFETGWASEVAKEKKWMAVRVDVDTKGEATNCRALDSSGSMKVDTKVCALAVKNANFVPAISASGEKVEAPYVLRIQMQE